MFRKLKTKLSLLFLVLITASLCLPLKTLAQSETPYDLVNAVNALRALHALEPYNIDPWLMSYAQEHAEYQATLQTGTHQHSDGSLPQDIGLLENVAGGDDGIVTVAIVVYEIWVDWGYRQPLIGYSTGDIGAGMALSENGQVYYTVNIRPGEEVIAVTAEPGTSIAPLPLETSTPGKDGLIIHIVSSGETLWSIAQSYAVRVDDIRRLNGMADDATLIYIGQKLLVRPANITPPIPSDETIAVPTEPVGGTAVPFTKTSAPTETLTLSSTMLQSSMVPSSLITETLIDTPSKLSLQKENTGLFRVLAVGIIGLTIAAVIGFWKSHHDKE